MCKCPCSGTCHGQSVRSRSLLSPLPVTWRPGRVALVSAPSALHRELRRLARSVGLSERGTTAFVAGSGYDGKSLDLVGMGDLSAEHRVVELHLEAR